MNILHTEWSDGWGGQEHRIVTEMVGMAGRGHRVTLATRPQAIIGKKARAAGIPVLELPFRHKLDLRSIRALVRFIRQEGVQVVNTHSGVDSWVGGLAARWARVGLVRTRHLNLPLHPSWHNFIHYLPQRIVACGEVMRRDLIARDGFPPEKVVSIPTGVDFGKFVPSRPRQEMRQTLQVPERAFLVLMVGVVRRIKRHEVALEAFAKFHRSHPNSLFLIVGDGPRLDDIKALARASGLASQVRFLGYRADIPDLMGAADCLLLTSASEGVPQAVTQALGCGLPVVATAVGGVPELVRDGETGLLVAPENSEATAAALGRIADDPSLAQHLAVGGKRHAHGYFSLEAMLDGTEAMYCGLTDQP
ncbi:glycosyltransferase family 4 protein [Azospira inquinata]|uniref:Glycosyltransferase family 4 protein n=1 Tax=Azospira inquinata TaxID=2785627 RepID=A0A975SL52_9RHOO|nr:glycosyltransferase family 4 protein [Azospira inquinata]QWT46762.1 glycosyltransferase family 4 protein [Azospira inquinata]QWT47915.1 glycosyltransferase family 4 protein [Azospira inquinata]